MLRRYEHHSDITCITKGIEILRHHKGVFDIAKALLLLPGRTEVLRRYNYQGVTGNKKDQSRYLFFSVLIKYLKVFQEEARWRCDRSLLRLQIMNTMKAACCSQQNVKEKSTGARIRSTRGLQHLIVRFCLVKSIYFDLQVL